MPSTLNADRFHFLGFHWSILRIGGANSSLSVWDEESLPDAAKRNIAEIELSYLSAISQVHCGWHNSIRLAGLD